MGLPIIIAVEDEGDVRADLQRDLARRYSADYQVLTTDVMEQAFTLNQVDSYITKPWEPAEEWLYPTVGDLLRDWVRVAEAGPRRDRLAVRDSDQQRAPRHGMEFVGTNQDVDATHRGQAEAGDHDGDLGL